MYQSSSPAVPSIAPPGANSTKQPRGPAGPKGRLKLLGAGLLAVGVLAAPLLGNLAPTLAATGTDGVLVTNNMTLPYGAAWLNDGQGGHLWVTDNLQGICRLDGSGGSNPPFAKSNCNGAVKGGGQIVAADPPAGVPGLPAGAKYVYVADIGSKSTAVVRFVFNPNTAAASAGTLQGSVTVQVPNPTSVGGGAGGGRPSGLALNGNDLYVGFLKSGDVMKVANFQTTTGGPPSSAVSKIGSTSDGKGVNNLLMFGNDLYLAEVGGFGLSKIGDPSGIARTACTAAAPCTAQSVKPTPSSFPGGLATDGTNIFIGDAPRAAPNSILRWNPATSALDTYSQNVPPYAASFDGGVRSQYVAPFGLGFGPGGDLYVGDDATQGLPLPGQAAPASLQGHIWKIPAAVNPLSVASVTNATADQTSPYFNTSKGSTLGGDQVSVVGKGFDTTPGATTVNFGSKPGTNVSCSLDATSGNTTCTTTSPAGSGTIDVRAVVGGVTSPISPADHFTYVAPPNTAISVSSVTNVPGFTTGGPNANGVITGGTQILINGQNLAVFDATGNPTTLPTVNVGAIAATSVACIKNAPPAADNTTCAATTQAGPAGTVDVQVTLNANTSPAVAGDKFTYVTPTASLYAWGITAPKGGAVWLPGNLGGHWWSSDHAQGLCRQDPVPGTKLHAINFGVCGNDLVGSAGQAVYDPNGTPLNSALHYVYVPDNAVKSTAVWRLTFDPSTETMVADPQGGAMATAMTPLADVRTLKPNGMALGPDGSLYVTDLTELNIRKITVANGDPRNQVISIVAQTGDLRGANGTQGFIGNLLYISENRGTSFFDVTQCPMPNGAPCGTIKIPLNVAPAGVFVAGTAVDAAHRFVYASDSPGGASAGIYRYDASNDNYSAFAAGTAGANPRCGAAGVPTTGGPGNKGCVVGSPAPLIVTGGTLPAAGAPEATVYCALTCQRPWDPNRAPPGGTTGFAFSFGLATDPNGNLVITEDPSAGARSGRGTMWTVPFTP